MVNNLKFERVEYTRSMGKLYAFVTCIDVQADGKGTHKKHYWGEVSAHNNAGDIQAVMETGGKWDQIPKPD